MGDFLMSVKSLLPYILLILLIFAMVYIISFFVSNQEAQLPSVVEKNIDVEIETDESKQSLYDDYIKLMEAL